MIYTTDAHQITLLMGHKPVIVHHHKQDLLSSIIYDRQSEETVNIKIYIVIHAYSYKKFDGKV
jgi:hypothetical protein